MQKYHAILEKHHALEKSRCDPKNTAKLDLIDYKLLHSREVLEDGLIIIDRMPDIKGNEALVKRLKTMLLLHDIGRFHNPSDAAADDFDHGSYGADLLLHDENMTDEAVYLAIKYHNKINLFDIPTHKMFWDKSASEKEEISFFSRLLKDADKFSNIRKWGSSGIPQVAPFYKHDLVFSEGVLDAFRNEQTVPNKNRKTMLDFYVALLCWHANIHFKETKALLKENGYFHAMISGIENYIRKTDGTPEQKGHALTIMEECRNTLKDRGFI